jgi:hypothetical protein
MSDLTFLPAVSMAEQIRKKKISPVEFVEECHRHRKGGGGT